MNGLTKDDISFLKAYGIRTVIDLRWEDEIESSPNPLAEEDFCTYYNIPFSGQPLRERNFLQDFTLSEFYVDLLEHSESVKTVFNTIALKKDGGVVFHCAAGKDRTGVLAMLLLGLAGVERKDIISNYEVTYTNMESFHDLVKQEIIPKNVPQHLLYSSREYIASAYDHVIETYESFEKYLLAKGIEQEVLDRVKWSLVAKEAAVVVK
jgi:protein-tyrosine phosphatase